MLQPGSPLTVDHHSAMLGFILTTWECCMPIDGPLDHCPSPDAERQAPPSRPRPTDPPVAASPLPDDAQTLLPPEDSQIDNPPGTDRVGVPGYEFLGELGRGGMGVVYKARQVKLNRLVALKMILSGAYAGEQELARFRIEAEAIAHLQHPNIVQIHEIGEHEGRPFFSLEF